MSDKRISELPLNTTPSGSDFVPTADSGGTSTTKATLSSLWQQGDFRYISPVFTYAMDGSLERITYADTSYKEFTYSGGKLVQIDFLVVGSPSIIRKTFTYSGDILTSITQTVV